MSALRCGPRLLNLDQPQVMGILNITPDSFSDGGQLLRGGKVDLDAARRRAEAMVADGASLIDVGGESTRPGAEPVSTQQELDRVAPIVEVLCAELDVVVSVDTSSATVINAVAALGAGMINDVRALQREGALDAAVASALPVCLMHMQGEPGSMQRAPDYEQVVEDVIAFLDRRMAACRAAGIPSSALLVDPGFGFGKTLEHNLHLLDQLQRLALLEAPILVGLSRKSMIGRLTGRDIADRLPGGLALVALAVYKGARIVRTHDVAATLDAVRVAAACRRPTAATA